MLVTAGRYMGISNVVTASSGAIAALIGGIVISEVSLRSGDPALGPRVAFAMTLAWYAIGSLALRRVDTRPYAVQMADRDAPAETPAVATTG